MSKLFIKIFIENSYSLLDLIMFIFLIIITPSSTQGVIIYAILVCCWLFISNNLKKKYIKNPLE